MQAPVPARISLRAGPCVGTSRAGVYLGARHGFLLFIESSPRVYLGRSSLPRRRSESLARESEVLHLKIVTMPLCLRCPRPVLELHTCMYDVFDEFKWFLSCNAGWHDRTRHGIRNSNTRRGTSRTVNFVTGTTQMILGFRRVRHASATRQCQETVVVVQGAEI